MTTSIAMQIMQERLETLWGSRGDEENHALRKSQLSAVQKVVAKIKTDAVSIAASLSQTNEALATTQSDLSAVQSDVSGLQTALTSVEGNIDTAISQLTALQDNLNGLSDDIDALTAAATSIADLRAAMQAVTADAITAENAVGATPTDAEHNALVADVTALRATVLALVGAAA